MLACEFSAVVHTRLEIPASVCTCRLAVRKRSHSAAWLEYISLVKVSVTDGKTITFITLSGAQISWEGRSYNLSVGVDLSAVTDVLETIPGLS